MTGELKADVKKKVDFLEKLFVLSDNADDCGGSFIIGNHDGIEILKLHYKHGMSYERIAEQLNLSVRTVYRKRKEEISRLQRICSEVGPPMEPETDTWRTVGEVTLDSARQIF